MTLTLTREQAIQLLRILPGFNNLRRVCYTMWLFPMIKSMEVEVDARTINMIREFDRVLWGGNAYSIYGLDSNFHDLIEQIVKPTPEPKELVTT